MPRILRVGRRTMMLVLVLAVAGGPAAAVLAQTASPPAAVPAVLVVPGRGIGNWTLDGKLADYVWKIGVPQTRTNGTDLVFRPQMDETSWDLPPIAVVYPPSSDTVWAVGTSDPGARTIDQVGVGSTEDQVTTAYNAATAVLQVPLRSKTLIYDTRGVAFELAYDPAAGQYGAARRVFVFRPGQAGAIWRLP